MSQDDKMRDAPAKRATQDRSEGWQRREVARATPRPNLLTWCVKQQLYRLYGHRS